MIGAKALILVSLCTEDKETPSIDPTWPIFKAKETDMDAWGHYEYFLYSKFKAHWKNGVDMFTKFGDHELAMNNAIVCASKGNFNFKRLLEKFKTLPPNTVVFNEWALAGSTQWHTPESHNPGPIPTEFVTSYSSFMKLVSLWKWIDSYKNQPDILDNDKCFAIMQRTMWQRNLQYTALNWPEEKIITDEHG